jgi:hypothetical protein
MDNFAYKCESNILSSVNFSLPSTGHGKLI